MSKMSKKIRTSDNGEDMPGSGLADWVLLTVISVALVGCDSLPTTRFASGLSAQERALAARLPVYHEGLPEGSYQLVGPVKGYSCQITFDEGYRVSEDNAIEELQRATFMAGAHAVMEVTCEHLGRRQGTRGCYRSIVCRGIAVQTTRVSAN
jgi:hypothetical protein